MDLTEAGEMSQPYETKLLHEEAEKAGRPVPRHHRFGIRDNDILADDKGYDKILDYIQSELDAGKIVYVHCWGGKGRTCTVIGCRLIDGGLDYHGAIAELSRLRAGTKKGHHHVPDTRAQHQVLRDRAACRNRDDTP
nr:serine/threonine protein phosphatase [Mycobacterium asiaticum]